MSQGSSIGENVSGIEIGPKSFGSVMTIADLNTLRSSCFVHDEFRMALAHPQERVHNPPIGGIGIYEETLKAVLRFSLHPFVVKLVGRFALSLAQIVPNSWRYIVGFLSLCSLHGRRPTISLFQAFFSLKRHPSSGGWWYFSLRSNRKLVLSVPFSIHGWKEHFFFIVVEVP